MENNRKQNKPVDLYKKLKQEPPGSLTADELPEAIRRDIRCIALIPEGMRIDGMPGLSKQEMDDIRFVCSENRSDEDADDFMVNKFDLLPYERRTAAVSQAAVLNDAWNLKRTPEHILTDEFIMDVLKRDGYVIFAVDESRRTYEMYRTALESSGRALKFFPKEMITPEIAMRAVENTGYALKYVPDEIKTPEMCRRALNDKSREFTAAAVIGHVPFSGVCLEYMKTIDLKRENPFAVFGSIRPEAVTPEMAQLAVRMEPECLRMVPEGLKTPEMCMESVKRDWHTIRHVPERLRTPEICLRAVMSNPEAKRFVPERFTGGYTVYEFYGKLKEELAVAGQLTFEQVQNVFNGETVRVSGLYFANVRLQDFTISRDGNTRGITLKAVEDSPERKRERKRDTVRQPERRRRRKM